MRSKSDRIIQAKKQADAKIRALTKFAEGSSHVGTHVGSAASSTAVASQKDVAPIAAGQAAIAKRNQELGFWFPWCSIVLFRWHSSRR